MSRNHLSLQPPKACEGSRCSVSGRRAGSADVSASGSRGKVASRKTGPHPVTPHPGAPYAAGPCMRHRGRQAYPGMDGEQGPPTRAGHLATIQPERHARDETPSEHPGVQQQGFKARQFRHPTSNPDAGSGSSSHVVRTTALGGRGPDLRGPAHPLGDPGDGRHGPRGARDRTGICDTHRG